MKKDKQLEIQKNGDMHIHTKEEEEEALQVKRTQCRRKIDGGRLTKNKKKKKRKARKGERKTPEKDDHSFSSTGAKMHSVSLSQPVKFKTYNCPLSKLLEILIKLLANVQTL